MTSSTGPQQWDLSFTTILSCLLRVKISQKRDIEKWEFELINNEAIYSTLHSTIAHRIQIHFNPVPDFVIKFQHSKNVPQAEFITLTEENIQDVLRRTYKRSMIKSPNQRYIFTFFVFLDNPRSVSKIHSNIDDEKLRVLTPKRKAAARISVNE